MKLFRSINLLSIAMCFCVVVFGAYVRLSDAGLGCPDWPGCYGHIGIPIADHEVAAAEEKFPERPVEAPKAWKEMIHRYLASTLGFLILIMAAMSLLKKQVGLPRRMPLALLGLVIFQGVLGMWTVTLQLKPLVVTAHLLGGMTTLALLTWQWLQCRSPATSALRPTPSAREPRTERQAALQWAGGAEAGVQPPPGRLRLYAGAALLVLVMQIFLGGWTSTNYAALACPDFPTCHGQWLPDTDLEEAFTMWRGLGVNYEFGVLDNRARVTIHLAHRIGAIVTTIVLGVLALSLLLRGSTPFWRGMGGVLLGALAVQISIGISTVVLQLPLLIAAAHNAGAALLLLSLVSLNFFAWDSHKR